MAKAEFTNRLRPAVQAGRFYESDPEALRNTILEYLGPPCEAGSTSPPIAIMAPHAGYLYSGRVAAAAYRSVMGRMYDRVLLLAPAHYVDFVGAALPAESAFATPLGSLQVDRGTAAALLSEPGVIVHPDAHRNEHAIEVQLPFLQVALPSEFQILPLAFGRPPEGGWGTIAEALHSLLDSGHAEGRQWLIVASTDTYHGYDREACVENDRRLQRLIETMDAQRLQQTLRSQEVMACGGAPLAVAMTLAARQGAMAGQTVMRSDSWEATAGSGNYVVGYIGAIFCHATAPNPGIELNRY